jgi:uncharacterized protein YjdB
MMNRTAGTVMPRTRRLPLLAICAIATLAACDSLFGPSVGPPAEVVMSTLPPSAQVGATISGITATVQDRDGKAVQGATVEWVAARGSVSPGSSTTDGDGVASTSWTLGTTAGPQALRARVDGLEAVRTVSATPGPLARIAVTPESLRFEAVGDTAMLSAEGTDAHGNPVAAHPINWTSTTPSVASVQDGRVISRGAGAAVISAEHAGVSEPVDVVVDQVMVGVRIAVPWLVLVPDETVALRAPAVDARGTPIDTTVTTSWSSTNPEVATVDQSGLLTARQPGTTVIAATAADYADEVTIEVRVGTRPSITAITPAVLSPGDTATITGSAFASTPAGNQVTVAGHPVQVTAATATQLRVVIPGAGAFPCIPTAAHAVKVSVDGFERSVDHPLTGAARRPLAVGESVTLLGGNVACNELTTGGTYLVSVFNTTNAATAQTAFKLRGTAPAAAMDVTATVHRQQHVHRPARPRLQPDPEADTHTWILEENARVGRELARHGRPQPRPAPGPLAALVAPGSTRAFRIPNLDATGLCANFLPVTARAVYVGDVAVIWEDQGAPLAGQMDDRWQEVGREYERVMHPIILEYFGDPLAYDAWMANPGRVHMLFSPAVNNFERGVNGFVFSGDFFPSIQCTQSNEAAIFYGRVPTASGSGYDGYTADTWAWSMRATIIHEVKHVVSYATRFRLWAEGQTQGTSPNYEVVWLEEATARLAEEFYGRALAGYGQGDNITYQESIWCERRVGANFPQCDPIPNVIHKHFSAIYGYYKGVESLSPLGPAQSGDATFYGSGWLLVRWAIDHSAMTEQSFSRALVHEPSLQGIDNLSARTGRSFPAMLGEFTLAMMTDDHPTGVEPVRRELAFPSWNTRDIMRGLHEDYQGTASATFFNTPWPLSHRDLAFGNFDADVAGIRGGTATFFRLTGAGASGQLLQLLSAGGITAPANLGVAIVRVN